MKKYIILALFPFIFFCSCGRQTKQDKNQTSIEITDYHNRKVQIKKDLHTIVSLSPGITELIFDLQSGDKLIGRTNYCTYPPQVQNITSIGGIADANVEKIVSLHPDVVIASSMLSKSKLEQIERAGIAIISLPERTTVEGVFQTIAILGRILDREVLSTKIIADMKQRIEAITKRNSDNKQTKRPKVYYVVGFGAGGDFSAGANTYIDDILTLAGGDNIAKSSVNWSFSREELFAKNPDFIFIRKEDYNQFIHTKPYSTLAAVRNHKVFPVDSRLMDCQTARSVRMIETISDIIHTK
ncbi:MAG: ABC transporter substrate-binding protein [Bacteroidales bacterium]|jgi:iron complex transport system substrate-binding protein|nr:ABC transporter substrate-binding protein [Bacteroidales bacterium]